MRGRSLLATCLFSLLGSCVGPGNGLRRIEHPEQPLEHRGVVCYPPAEGAWWLGEDEEQTESGLLFREDLGAPDPSAKIGPSTFITLFIADTPPAEFSKHYPGQHAALEALARAAARPSSGRFKDLSSETSWGTLQGQEFVRLTRSREERDNPVDPAAVLREDERTTWLFHPHQPATVVRVVVSHRRPAGGEFPSLVELEQSFLARLAFR